MSVHNCPDCKDTGEFRHDTEDFDRLCDCSTGQALLDADARLDRRDRLNNSADLLLRSEAAHKVRMDMLGKHQCKSFGGQYCSIWLDEPGCCEQCEREMG